MATQSPPVLKIAHLLICFQVVCFIIGYILQDITLALKVGLAGTALVFLVIVPPWPFFNRHPVKWLPIGGGSAVTSTHQNVVVDEKLFVKQ
jgi:signal peptidase complex subunit 1